MEHTEFLPHLEIQAVEHCNLNCASCTHFSPLAEPRFVDKNMFFCQLQKANSIFSGHCRSLKVMGGEPLLHPEISELLALARQAMPYVKLTLQTNGILLTSLGDEFWRACHDHCISVRVTRYPVKLELEEIQRRARKSAVDLKYHPADDSIKSFNLYPLNLAGDGCPEENYGACKMRMRYVLIKDGRLYPCPIAGNAEHFSRAFRKELWCGDGDSVALDELQSFDAYRAFAEKGIPFCRFCLPTQYRRDVGWARSQKAISEWI